MLASFLRYFVAIFCLLFASSNVYTKSSTEHIFNVVKAPAFNIKSFSSGKTQQENLAHYQGQVIYLDFWASWCQPCQHSFSWMNKMQARYGDKGLTIIAVNLDASLESANQFLEENPANFKVAFDYAGSTAQAYKVTAMPNSFIVNQKGNITYKNLGFHPKDEAVLEDKIKALLNIASTELNTVVQTTNK